MRISWTDDIDLARISARQVVDAYVVACDIGYSPLRVNHEYIAANLDFPEKQLLQLAEHYQRTESTVSLVAIHSLRSTGSMLGVVLVPSQRSLCYQQFACGGEWAKPYRDFYYNVTFEALALCTSEWGARHVVLTHTSGQKYDRDIARCVVDAAVHLERWRPGGLISLVCAEPTLVATDDISVVLSEGHGEGSHSPIDVHVSRSPGYLVKRLDWSRRQSTRQRST